jgi:nickel-dependent lactate racemase
MAKGTKDLRQATMVLLNNAKEELEKVKGRCIRARERVDKNCKHYVHPDNYHASDRCGHPIDAVIADSDKNQPCTAAAKCTNFKQSVEEWIIMSWELECTLLEHSIDQMEKWIVEDDYDY